MLGRLSIWMIVGNRPQADPRVETAIRRVCELPARLWTVEALAAEVALSVSRFRELFQSGTGTTPIRFLRDYRLDCAARLLRTSRLPIKDVMAQVGICDGSHFARNFKRAYGTSPAVYRERQQQLRSICTD